MKKLMSVFFVMSCFVLLLSGMVSAQTETYRKESDFVIEIVNSTAVKYTIEDLEHELADANARKDGAEKIVNFEAKNVAYWENLFVEAEKLGVTKKTVIKQEEIIDEIL